MQVSGSLDVTFSALADPTRRAILAQLSRGEASVGELAKPFDISLPAVSRHLRVLETAHLIAREKDGQWRRCRLLPEPLREASDWIETYRQFWEGQFDRLAEYLDKTDPEKGLPDERSNPRTGKRDDG